MTDKRLFITTAPTREEANTIATELVSRRLAACVNVLGPISSVYSWQGAVEHSEEFLLLVKSTENNGNAIQDAIRELHSYQIPELIAFTVESGLENYLNWITSSVRK
jgi:periplasmic divalent cation tolerance protein